MIKETRGSGGLLGVLLAGGLTVLVVMALTGRLERLRLSCVSISVRR